jgi:uncharacterized protein YqfB (UPF0267 family)
MVVDLRQLCAMAVGAIAMCISAGGRADFDTGNTLYAACTKSDRTYCEGYIAAVSDATLQPLGSVMGFKHCAAAEVTLQQMEDVVTQYLAAHPEQRHLGAISLAAHALAEVFPCR